VERFFEHLGLDKEAFLRLTKSPTLDSPVFFDSVSSAASCLDSNAAEVEDTPTFGPGGGKFGEQPSIVERNARIVKWLFNCRKTQSSALS
jgi:hypothetical protein